MKKLTFFLLFLGAMAHSFAANKYWVGISGANWENTSSWSDISSAGASGATVPTTGDDVFFETGALTVTLTAIASVNSITFTSSDVTFAGAFATTTTNMTLDNSQINFVNNVTINSALAFSGTTSTLAVNTGSNASGLTIGDGGSFSLTGNSTDNTIGGDGFISFNTTSALTVYLKSATTLQTLKVVKGLITLGNNITAWRLTLSNTNSQELILGENVTLTLLGKTTSYSCGLTSLANGGVLNASASGSKFSINYKSATFMDGTKRLFKTGTVINNLEFKSSGYTFKLFEPITVDTLTLTAGTIDNATNSITIAPGGSVVTVAGATTAAVIYDGATGVNTTSKPTAQVFVNAQNEIVINATENSNYAIYSAVGQLIAAGKIINNLPLTINNSKGVFVVKVNNKSTRVIIK